MSGEGAFKTMFCFFSVVCLSSLCLVFGGCASVVSRKLPQWVNNPLANCENGFMCAVGEGKSIVLASSNARSELAKQFSVNIKSNSSFSISQKNNNDEQSASYLLYEGVSEMLSGVIIKEVYNDGAGNCYAFAVVDKNKLENEALLKVENIDNELQNNIVVRPVPVKKLKKLIVARQEKNQKYMGLTGKSVAEKITMKDVRKAKGEPNFYRLEEIKNDTLNLQEFIRSETIEHLDKISKDAEKVISGDVNIKKQYLNVDGFEKYEVFVSLACKQGNKTIGNIRVNKSGTGRNKQQAIDVVKEEIFKEISEKIDSLLM